MISELPGVCAAPTTNVLKHECSAVLPSGARTPLKATTKGQSSQMCMMFVLAETATRTAVFIGSLLDSSPSAARPFLVFDLGIL